MNYSVQEYIDTYGLENFLENLQDPQNISSKDPYTNVIFSAMYNIDERIVVKIVPLERLEDNTTLEIEFIKSLNEKNKKNGMEYLFPTIYSTGTFEDWTKLFKLKTIYNLPRIDKIRNNYLERKEGGIMVNKCSYIIYSLHNGSLNMWKNHTHTDNSWKSILFQLVSGVHYLQSVFPNFKHNDLTPQNILIEKTDCILSIKWNDIKYTIRTKYIIKFWDFEWAHSDEIPNNNIIQKRDFFQKTYNITNRQNIRMDLHYIFNILYTVTKFIPEESKKFLYNVSYPHIGDCSQYDNCTTIKDYRILKDELYESLSWKNTHDLLNNNYFNSLVVND